MHLAGQGNHRALITLIETWAQLAVPSTPCRLAEARSFVSLRMVDRAWVRLKDLVECAEPDIEALQIAAQMFLLRGWQNQARKVIQRGLDLRPDDPLLCALRIQADEEPPSLDDVVSEDAPSAELVRVAELHMARGAFVRARTLLERVRRREPGHARTAELLWAIRGEFASAESLASMCERWGPDPLSQQFDSFEEPEHTETVRLDDLRVPENERSFPLLFRNLDADGTIDPTDPGTDSATPEVTAVTSLAEVGEYDPATPERTDFGEDTQIARVMRRGGVMSPIDTPLHTGRSSVDSSFNLAEFRREMGISARLESDLASDLAGPEDEDDSLVFHTGAESEPEDTGTSAPISLELSDERMAKAKQGANVESWVSSMAQTRTAPSRSAPPKSAPPKSAPPKSSPKQSWPPQASHRRADAKTVPLPLVPSEVEPADMVTEVPLHTPEPPGFEPEPPEFGAGWGPPQPLVTWPYWVAALLTVFVVAVLLFLLLAVVFAIV